MTGNKADQYMLLYSDSEESNIVYRYWHKNYAYTQVREYIEEWEIKSFARILGIEMKLVSKCSRLEPFEEMVKQAHRNGLRLENNAGVLQDVIDNRCYDLAEKYMEIVGDCFDEVQASLHNWAMERVRHELLSGEVEPIEIIDHVEHMFKRLCSDIKHHKSGGITEIAF